jgi:hypothetical protein
VLLGKTLQLTATVSGTSTTAVNRRSCLARKSDFPVSPPNVTGIYGAQVVAVDAASGAVIAGTIGGWSCYVVGPTQFDGGYQIQKLPVGRSYIVYAEPLELSRPAGIGGDGAVSPSQIANAIQTVCRNATQLRGARGRHEFTVRTRAGP